MSVASVRTAPVERTWADRLIAIVPLASIFLWLCVVYALEAWAHATPWLFGDELELTQLSRSIADTGHAARRGEPHSFNTLWTYVMAPAWVIDDVHTAYSTVKYLAVLLMTATVFPAYGIARAFLAKWPALFVALASAAIPALAYSSMLVEEPLAYPYSTFCLFLILRALATRSKGWIAGAAAASLIAPLVRGELGVLLAVFALAAAFLVWRSDWLTGQRRSWQLSDWVGTVVLAVGSVVIVSAILGHRSLEWLISTTFYKDRLFELGLDAAGALAIGVGVLPFVAGLAALWPARGEERRSELSAFRSVLLASIIAFGLYTAVKATYVSTVFGTYTYERNLIYLAPLLFAGTALWLQQRRLHPVALAVSAAFTLALLLTTPYEMGQDISYNAPGLAILQQANRYLRLDPTGAKIGLVALLLLSTALLLAPRYLRRGASWLALAVAAGVVAWNLTGELAFASASNRTSERFINNIRKPLTWVDDATGGAPTLYIGQQMRDQNGEWLLEFWNRSVQSVFSLDGTAQGPGPVRTPDPRPTDGALSHDPGYPYVVVERGIDIVGVEVARHLHVAGGSPQPWRLIQVEPPLRLRASVTGLYPDGWSGEFSSYTRYSTEGGKTGRVRVEVARPWGGPATTGRVTIRIGPIVIGDDKQPHVVRASDTTTFELHNNEQKQVFLQAPGPRFRIEVTISPTFTPSKLVPGFETDNRELGGKLRYVFLPPRKTAQR